MFILRSTTPTVSILFACLLAICSCQSTRYKWLSLPRFTSMAYRSCNGLQPRIRSPLARAVYKKMITDMESAKQDHSSWYTFAHDKLPGELSEKFVQLSEDVETKLFLQQCHDKSNWLFTQLYHAIAKSLLTWIMTSTSANGLLWRGSMFVFSQTHITTLFSVSDDWKADTLLDLGAGDGAVTDKLARHFNHVYVTETSRPMVWRLQNKHFHILSLDDWHAGDRRYDVVSCLNLLDRCSRPLTLLRQIRSVLVPETGRLLVAVVIPFRPYVESGVNNHVPVERILISGQTFSEQVTSLINEVFIPVGFSVVKLTKLPYLCEGDLEKAFYILNDAVFILKPNS